MSDLSSVALNFRDIGYRPGAVYKKTTARNGRISISFIIGNYRSVGTIATEAIKILSTKMDQPSKAWGMDLYYVRSGFQVDRELVEKLKGRRGFDYRESTRIASKQIDFMVKVTRRRYEGLNEARNILFVAEKTSIPVPSVLAFITYGPVLEKADYVAGQPERRENVYYTYLLTDIPLGITLRQTLLDSPTEAERIQIIKTISAELKGYLSQLQGMRRETYIGSLDYRPVADPKFTLTENRGMFDRSCRFWQFVN